MPTYEDAEMLARYVEPVLLAKVALRPRAYAAVLADHLRVHAEGNTSDAHDLYTLASRFDAVADGGPL